MGEQRVAALVAHFAGDEAVEFARRSGRVQAVFLDAAVDGGRADLQPGGDVGHRPAEQPDEAELTEGAFAVWAKARRGSGSHVRCFHGREHTPAVYAAGFAR